MLASAGLGHIYSELELRDRRGGRQYRELALHAAY